MKLQKQKIGDKLVWPFTIPSGIITTEVSCLERIANEIPEIGILTTKSIGPEPRAGNREPIIAQYMLGGFVNAVGLTNPGAEEFAKKLSSAKIPSNKFLLASIFGKDIEDFVYVAKTLEKFADGFELNLSCPHAKGYGMQLGQDPEIVARITKAVTGITKKPVFVKLTPNVTDIGAIAKSAMENKAYGITAINTVGPGSYLVDGHEVLTNKVGGLSGAGITPIGIKCVRDITQKLGKIPIIAAGGIATVKDVEDYASVGALFFGIGSALAGMNEYQIKNYFAALVDDLRNNGWTGNASIHLKKVNMEYTKMKITRKENIAGDFKIIQTNYVISAEPGQFVFAWIPGIGEKPFSVMDDNPLTLGILERGEFTKEINSLKEGDSFYVRGPYGNGVNIPDSKNIVLVGGGCGIAGLYLLAKEMSRQNNVTTLIGAKDRTHLAGVERSEWYGKVHISTEDGSIGVKGTVVDLFKQISSADLIYNCGPKAMVTALLPLEARITRLTNIYSSVDYLTSCGTGICGKCADEKGRRTCVEGPFMNP